MIRAGIIGGAGYTAGELVRLLVNHPAAEIAWIHSESQAGKAVIALTDEGEFAGFSYIESWGGKSFVANSGLIVAHKFRGMGLAKRIKEIGRAHV